MSGPKKKPSRRRYPVNRIKLAVSYDTHEIAKLFGIHRNTVRQWLNGGLATIDDRRPALVYGAALKAFIAERQHARRRNCAPGEFYCFKCRLPRKPWGGMADASPHTDKIVKLTALCCACETEMHRTIRRTDLPKFAALIEIRMVGFERLSDSPNASANSDFERDRHGGQAQPEK